jgi:hypothetical protein
MVQMVSISSNFNKIIKVYILKYYKGGENCVEMFGSNSMYL